MMFSDSSRSCCKGVTFSAIISVKGGCDFEEIFNCRGLKVLSFLFLTGFKSKLASGAAFVLPGESGFKLIGLGLRS